MRSCHRILSLLLLLTTLACASPGTRTAPGLPDIEVPDLETRAMLLLFVDRQLFEPLVVEQALRGGPELREELAVALGRIPDRQGRRVLIGLLLDEVPAVRRAAAFSLGELEDPEGAEALLRALQDPDRETAVLAVEALGKLGVPVVQVAEQLLPLPEEERWARLLPHLFRFREEATVRLAERGLTRPEPELRVRAAYALAREPRPEALPVLRPLLADADPRVRAWAARALGIAGEAEDFGRLRPLLADSDPGPVIHALRAAQALARKDSPGPEQLAGWRPRLRQLLDDPRPGVAITVVENGGPWISGAPDGPFAQEMVRRASTGRGRERGLALLALAGGKHPRTAELVAAAAADADPAAWDVRAHAAQAAGELGGQEEVLARLAADPVAAVRGAAVGASLAVLSDSPQEGADLARAALRDADPAVQAAAVDWLAEHPVVPLAALEALLPSALRPGEEEVGLVVINALRARAEAETLERGAGIALLEKIAAGSPYAVRRAAGQALGELGRPVPALGEAFAGRPVAAYREIVQRTARPRTVEIRTSKGPVRVRLACPQAPLTCLNFLQLAEQGYFDGSPFHRVVPDFVAQGGAPREDGFGGPDYAIRDEINRLRYTRGVVGMALAGPDTGGSQFFFTLQPHPHLDGGYTAFGEVTAGMEVVDRLAVGDRIEGIAEVR